MWRLYIKMSLKIRSGNTGPTFSRGNHWLSVIGPFIGACEGQRVTAPPAFPAWPLLASELGPLICWGDGLRLKYLRLKTECSESVDACSGSQQAVIAPSRGHWPCLKPLLIATLRRVLLASSGWRPGMLPNVPQGTQDSPLDTGLPSPKRQWG